MVAQYLSEFVGTFILLAFITAFKNPVLITVGFLLAIIISGDLSGGHINPAVSIAQVFTGALPASALPGYILAQVAGAVSAVYLVKRFM